MPTSLRAIASRGVVAAYDVAGIEGRDASVLVIAWRPRGVDAGARLARAFTRAVPTARTVAAGPASAGRFTAWRFAATRRAPAGAAASMTTCWCLWQPSAR